MTGDQLPQPPHAEAASPTNEKLLVMWRAFMAAPIEHIELRSTAEDPPTPWVPAAAPDLDKSSENLRVYITESAPTSTVHQEDRWADFAQVDGNLLLHLVPDAAKLGVTDTSIVHVRAAKDSMPPL